jgi:hypothetical protein
MPVRHRPLHRVLRPTAHFFLFADCSNPKQSLEHRRVLSPPKNFSSPAASGPHLVSLLCPWAPIWLPNATSPTTGATRCSSRLASTSSSGEPPPPLRALAGEPLLPEMPQSSSPHYHVVLAAVPDPPRQWSALKSRRPPPPQFRAPTVPLFSRGSC